MTPNQRKAILGGVLALVTSIAPFVQRQEGTRLHAYPDAVLGWKAPTACTGHMDPDMDHGAAYTQAECDAFLRADLTKTYDGIAECIGDIDMPDRELSAFLSLALNIGPANFCRGSFAKKLKAGDHVGACNLIRQYRFVSKADCLDPANKCRGIVRRRDEEARLCLGE